MRALTHEADTVSNREWDEAVTAFDDVSLEQTAAYASARWGADKNSHIVIRDGGEIVAGARAVLFTIPGLKKGLAYVKFGPLWRRGNTMPDPQAYRAALRGLTEEYCNKRGLLLSILPRPNPDMGAIEQAMLEECGFVNRRPWTDSARYFVDLSLDEDAQRASLGQKWRYNLRKAANANLEIELAAGAESIRRFQALHGQMVARKNASHGDAVDLLPGLQDALPPGLSPKIVIASHDGKPVAGAVVALHGDTAYYVYGASGGNALELRAGYGLQWWIVRWLSGQGVRWYDLGGTVGNAGLKQFKGGLSGRQGRIVDMQGEYDMWSSRTDRIAGDTLFALRGLSQRIAGFRASG